MRQHLGHGKQLEAHLFLQLWPMFKLLQAGYKTEGCQERNDYFFLEECSKECMCHLLKCDAQIDMHKDGWMDGWLDRQVDRCMDGQMNG